MKWLIKIIDYIERETWWRRHYKRITLSEKVALRGRCLKCDAAEGELRCDLFKRRECPCKWNQCLKLK